MSEPNPERTALYRYFDADGDLLYIGISKDPEGRWMAHRGNRAPWIHQAVRRVDEWFDSRPLALKAEETAIKSERPPYNEKHNYDDVTFHPNSWPRVATQPKIPAVAILMRAEISSGRWLPGQRIPSLRTMSGATGASVSLVSKASAILQEEGLLDFQPGRGLFVVPQRAERRKLPHDWFYQFGFPG